MNKIYDSTNILSFTHTKHCEEKKIVIAQLKNLTFAYVVLYDDVISSMTQAAFTVDVFYPEAFFC